MSKDDCRIELAQSQEREAYYEKQNAYSEYQKIRLLTDEAYIKQQETWEKHCRARDKLSHEYGIVESKHLSNSFFWNEYQKVLKTNRQRIARLRRDVILIERDMTCVLERASIEVLHGDKTVAEFYYDQGDILAQRLTAIRLEIKQLKQEIRDAKDLAEHHGRNIDASAYGKAKSEFNKTEAEHKKARAEFLVLKDARNKSKARFQKLEDIYLQKKEELVRVKSKKRLEYLSKVSCFTNQVDLSSVDLTVPHKGKLFGYDAKIVPRSDSSGKVDIYFAGLNDAGDGIGHGHAVVNSSGKIVFIRDAWMDRN